MPAPPPAAPAPGPRLRRVPRVASSGTLQIPGGCVQDPRSLTSAAMLPQGGSTAVHELQAAGPGEGLARRATGVRGAQRHIRRGRRVPLPLLAAGTHVLQGAARSGGYWRWWGSGLPGRLPRNTRLNLRLPGAAHAGWAFSPLRGGSVCSFDRVSFDRGARSRWQKPRPPNSSAPFGLQNGARFGLAPVFRLFAPAPRVSRLVYRAQMPHLCCAPCHQTPAR
jgi:hypothetical protein